MPSKYWIKLYHEILDDPKMGQLPDHLWRRVIELFLLAGDFECDGYLPSSSDMAWRLRIDEQVLESELTALSEFGIIENRDERWYVSRFSERQAHVSNAERQSRYRDRQRQKQYYGNDNSNEPVTAGVTKRNTDTDIDIDTESEEDTNGADAPPVNLDGWLSLVQESKNRPAALKWMHDVLYPGRDAPDYGYIGRAAKTVGGAGRLAALLWQSQAYHPNGDVLRYCMGMAKGRKDGKESPLEKSMAAVEAMLEREEGNCGAVG